MGCQYIHIVVNGRQLTLKHTLGIHKGSQDQLFTAQNGKHPRLTKAFVRTVSDIQHHDVVRSGNSTDQFYDKYPQGWTTQTVVTLEKATEAYMVEVVVESHC